MTQWQEAYEVIQRSQEDYLVVIIVVLDRPFKGYGRISPEPFVQVLARFRLLGD